MSFLIWKIIPFSHFKYMYPMYAAVSQCLPATLTPSPTSCLCLPPMGQGSSLARLWRGWREMGCVLLPRSPAKASSSSHAVSPGTRCSLELPRLLGLGSCTALIQFTMQLHNCSQSPVDLDVKLSSSGQVVPTQRKEEEPLVGPWEHFSWGSGMECGTERPNQTSKFFERVKSKDCGFLEDGCCWISRRWMLLTFRAILCHSGFW